MTISERDGNGVENSRHGRDIWSIPRGRRTSKRKRRPVSREKGKSYREEGKVCQSKAPAVKQSRNEAESEDEIRDEGNEISALRRLALFKTCGSIFTGLVFHQFFFSQVQL